MTAISKKKSTTKKAAKKKVAKKNATRKKVSKKKAVSTTKKAAKVPTKSSRPDTSSLDITPEERWKMIAIAAYHKAEKRGFAPGYELQDWSEAEKEIDKLMNG